MSWIVYIVVAWVVASVGAAAYLTKLSRDAKRQDQRVKNRRDA